MHRKQNNALSVLITDVHIVWRFFFSYLKRYFHKCLAGSISRWCESISDTHHARQKAHVFLNIEPIIFDFAHLKVEFSIQSKEVYFRTISVVSVSTYKELRLMSHCRYFELFCHGICVFFLSILRGILRASGSSIRIFSYAIWAISLVVVNTRCHKPSYICNLDARTVVTT